MNEENQNSSVFAAVGIVGVTVFFLASAAFAGKLLREDTPEESAAESVYYPPSMTETESYQKTTLSDTSYPSGDYAVGTDIPPGVYYAVGDFEEFYFGIYAEPYVESESTPPIGGGWQQNSAYFELENGQYIHFSHSKLYKTYGITHDTYQTKSGMYLVGTDIPAGTYTITANQDYPGRYTVFDSARISARILDENQYIETGSTADVTLYNGEYLQMKFCTASEKNTAPTAEVNPASYPAGVYDVGIDIEPGVYVAIFNGNDPDGQFRLDVYENNPQNIVSGGWAQNCRYIELQEHQTIDFSDAVLYNWESPLMPDPYQTPGMYSVGKDIPEGKYTVKANSDASGMVVIYDTANKYRKAVTSKSLKNGQAEIEVKARQFLELRNCILDK